MMPAAVLEAQGLVEPQTKRQTMDGSNRSRSWLEPSAILDPRSNANACQEPESSVQRAQCGTCT